MKRLYPLVVLLCIASMVFRGFNFGIDFAGGNSFRLPGTESWSTEDLRVLSNLIVTAMVATSIHHRSGRDTRTLRRLGQLRARECEERESQRIGDQ